MFSPGFLSPSGCGTRGWSPTPRSEHPQRPGLSIAQGLARPRGCRCHIPARGHGSGSRWSRVLAVPWILGQPPAALSPSSRVLSHRGDTRVAASRAVSPLCPWLLQRPQHPGAGGPGAAPTPFPGALPLLPGTSRPGAVSGARRGCGLAANPPAAAVAVAGVTCHRCHSAAIPPAAAARPPNANEDPLAQRHPGDGGQRVPRAGVAAAPSEALRPLVTASEVAHGGVTSTHSLPVPWQDTAVRSLLGPGTPKATPGSSTWGWEPPPIPSMPPQSQKNPKKPLKPRPQSLVPLSPLRLWAGFSCPRALIVLIRSTGFDEGFTRNQKAGRQEEIMESQMTFPSPSLSHRRCCSPAGKLCVRGEENYHNLPLQDETKFGWSREG